MTQSQSTAPIQPQPAADAKTTTAAPAGGATVEDIMKVCPDADKNSVQKMYPLLAKEMAAMQMTSRNHLIAVAATVSVETTSWGPIREGGKGGGKYGPYYGRGLIQLT